MKYIGARYVPKFAGTYDATQAYENMIVVDNGMGTSYISQKPVPASTPLTDTSYWAVYGASSGAIVDLQNKYAYLLENKIPIYPEDFGAEGDGLTDDTSAMQDCFDAAENKMVVLRNSYKITSTLTASANMTLYGGEIIDAIPTTLIPDIGINFLIHIDSKNGVVINGVHFTGGTPTQYDASTGYMHDLIEVDNSDNVKIVNNFFDCVNAARTVVFHGCKYCNCDFNMLKYSRYAGIAYTDNSMHCTLNHNTYEDLGWSATPSYALIFSTADHAGDYSTKYCTDIECAYNYISYPNTTHTWECISAHGASLCNIHDNTILDCRFGIACGSEIARQFLTVGTKIYNNLVQGRQGSDFDSSYGIYVGGNNISIKNNLLLNCGRIFNSSSVLGSSGAICVEQYSTVLEITDNFMQSCGGCVFYFGASSTHPTGYTYVVIKNNCINGIAYGGGGRNLIAISTSAKLSSQLLFTKNEINIDDTNPRVTGWDSSTDSTNSLVMIGNSYRATPSYSNAAKIITDYINGSDALLSVNGIQGMLRRIWSATATGHTALQLFTNTWHDINLS